jgi:hypothetical protein
MRTVRTMVVEEMMVEETRSELCDVVNGDGLNRSRHWLQQQLCL